MNTRIACIALLGASLLLGACAPNILVQQDPAATLPGPATYAWDTQPAPTTPAPTATDLAAGPATVAGNKLPGDDNPRVNNDIVKGMLHQALTSGLEKRGYSRSDKPAWLLSYNVGLRRRMTVYEQPLPRPMPMICNPFYGCFDNGWGWGGWGGWYGPPMYTADTVTSNELTLMIDLRDAMTHRLVWRGLLTHDINLTSDLQTTALQKDVDEVLEKLPGPGKK